jgi:hypothetical protein
MTVDEGTALLRSVGNYLFIIKANEMHYFSALFGNERYTFRTDLLSIIRSLNTVFTAIGICHNSYVDCLLTDSQQDLNFLKLHFILNKYWTLRACNFQFQCQIQFYNLYPFKREPG